MSDVLDAQIVELRHRFLIEMRDVAVVHVDARQHIIVSKDNSRKRGVVVDRECLELAESHEVKHLNGIVVQIEGLQTVKPRQVCGGISQCVVGSTEPLQRF